MLPPAPGTQRWEQQCLCLRVFLSCPGLGGLWARIEDWALHIFLGSSLRISECRRGHIMAWRDGVRETISATDLVLKVKGTKKQKFTEVQVQIVENYVPIRESRELLCRENWFLSLNKFAFQATEEGNYLDKENTVFLETQETYKI